MLPRRHRARSWKSSVPRPLPGIQRGSDALAQIEALVRRFLTPAAQDRLSNLNLVDPELVQKLKIYLAQLYASGQIKQMDDEQLKAILMKLKGSKREITIKRR